MCGEGDGTEGEDSRERTSVGLLVCVTRKRIPGTAQMLQMLAQIKLLRAGGHNDPPSTLPGPLIGSS